MKRRTMLLLGLMLSTVGVLTGCDLFRNDGKALVVERLHPVAGVFLSQLSTISGNHLLSDRLWADANFTVPLDLKTIISIEGQTIISTHFEGTIELTLAAPLDPLQDYVAEFDTTRVFYGTSGASVSLRQYKYQFSDDSVPVVFE